MDGITSQVKYSDFEELKKKVNHLEYEELKEVRGDIQDIKESMAKNDVLLQQNISSSEKLNTTLNNVQRNIFDPLNITKDMWTIVGSVGKKSESGDLDICIDIPKVLEATNSKTIEEYADKICEQA